MKVEPGHPPKDSWSSDGPFRVTVERFSLTDLKGLFEGSIRVLRVRHFVNIDFCVLLAQRVSASAEFVQDGSLRRIGRPYSEVRHSEDARVSYFRHQEEWVGLLRTIAAPYLSPFDRLRLELDDLWPSGALRAAASGNKLFAGMIRSFPEGAHSLPHVDLPSVAGVCRQFAANIYIETANKGGVLQVWCERTDPLIYELYADEFGSIRRYVEGRLPDLEFTPEAGDLVMFDASLIHSVTPVAAGSRVSWSAFIGFQESAAPLLIWS